MKCPVCTAEIKSKESTCPICGFEDIRYEFINDEELRMWQNYVVNPCKYAYRLNFLMLIGLTQHTTRCSDRPGQS